MNNLNHIFGTDPEAFIFDKFIKDEKLGLIPNIIPPIALVHDFGATYETIKGKNVLIKTEEFQWSEDGAAIELQMNPTNDSATFLSRIALAKIELNSFLSQFNLEATTAFPVGFFNLNKYWKKRNEDFRSCVIFGCDPDEFPYKYIELGLDDPENKHTLNVETHKYRYGGGHIHIQAPTKNPEIYLDNWAKASIVFDFLAGLGNVSFAKPTQTRKLEKFRLNYYGKPGRIRLQFYKEKPKTYGIEYRALSNSWTNYPNMTNNLLHLLDIAATVIEKDMGDKFITHFEKDIPLMHKTIRTLNKTIATTLLQRCLTWTKKNIKSNS